MDKAVIEKLQIAVSINPRFAEGHFAIGNIFRSQNNLNDALSSYQKAIAAKPDFEAAYLSAGNILVSQKRFDIALKIYQDALVALPDSSAVNLNLAIVLFQTNRFSDALLRFERAIALDSRCADVIVNIGQSLVDRGKLHQAVQLVQLVPQSTRSLMLLGDAYNLLGKVVNAIDCWRKAIEIDPNFLPPYQFILLHSHYLQGYTREKIFSDHAAFGERLEASWKHNWPTLKSIDLDKRLRIGFVSYDLIEVHPVGCFLESVLRELHDINDADIIIYSANPTVDMLTERIQSTAHLWVGISGLSDDQFEKRIRDDKIDILVDLSGHTNGNRLSVFARKPAPIQVTWLGYWNTTGLQSMDYILCDPFCVRDDEDNLFVEKPWYLPHTRLCFTPPNLDLPVASLPALSNGYVTFGCFNNMNKITDQVVKVWSRIFRQIPNSKLLLKWKSYFDSSAREEMIARFAAEGISFNRLWFQSTSPLQDYFLAYNLIDIALDPFPFTGGATSAQGIWMGVPMISMRGDSMISRQGESMLHNLGLPDWIANDEDDYVEMALNKAADLEALARLRGELRFKLESSPLSSAKLFAKNLGDSFRGMWKEYCRNS